jgi:hypothetical protein
MNLMELILTSYEIDESFGDILVEDITPALKAQILKLQPVFDAQEAEIKSLQVEYNISLKSLGQKVDVIVHLNKQLRENEAMKKQIKEWLIASTPNLNK